MRTSFKWAIAIMAIAAAGYGGFEFIMSEGHSAIAKIAQEKKFCETSDDGCKTGTTKLLAALATAFKTTPSMMKWCAGVAEIDQVRVHKGGGLKAILVSGLYTPCKSIFAKKDENGLPEVD